MRQYWYQILFWTLVGYFSALAFRGLMELTGMLFEHFG